MGGTHEAAERRILRIRSESKPVWYEWMELSAIAGKRACLESLDNSA